MTWMNEFDVDSAYSHFSTYREEFPNGYRAVQALDALVEWTNANSDGWPYWTKPSNASQRLQAWLDGWRNRWIANDNDDLSEADLKQALRPIKAFLTKQGADWKEVITV